jgi:transposase
MITSFVVLGVPTTQDGPLQEAIARVEHLEGKLARTQAQLVQVTAERDKLRRAYEQIKEHLELLRRRIFVAKAERIDTTQLEMEFAQTQRHLDALAKELSDPAGTPPADSPADPPPATPPPPADKPRPKPTGRRDLALEDLPVERIELLDPSLEGQAERIGFEESNRLGYRRAGAVCLVLARATYKVEEPAPAMKPVAIEPVATEPAVTEPAVTEPAVTEPAVTEPAVTEPAVTEPAVTEPVATEPAPKADPAPGPKPVVKWVTTKKPKELFERGLLAPSMIAHLLVAKFRWGLPFHRQARMLEADGVKLDHGTMCRYAEDAGATLGCIVDACIKDAKQNAFCLSTDATGICIQPEPRADRQRQPCRKGHFFVVLADRDHVFFEYQPKHTSAAVCEMFRGFSGYIQADAHAIYDAIFRGEARATPDDKLPQEVACWSHCRRRAWEAAVVAKDPAAREALLRMRALFQLEEQWADLPPSQRHARRQLVSRPLVDDFFAWVTVQYARVKDTRGLVATAFGYAVRQKDALRRFLDDGRLPMTNNHSERAIRPIAVGRRAWLFFGSDDHASAAANVLSLIASSELHRLDPETYLTEIIHVLPYWPRDRYLELAPKYWAATRARLRPKELAVEIGPITVPPPLPPQEQPTPS